MFGATERRLEIPFWFQDALSGEFHPPQDPKNSAHTLARLSMGTYLKGEHRPDSAAHDEELATATYSPSWAPLVTSTIMYRIVPEFSREPAQLLDITLTTPNVPRATFSIGGNGQVLFINDGEKVKGPQLSLELGPQIALAQRVVAATAELFFLNAATVRQQ